LDCQRRSAPVTDYSPLTIRHSFFTRYVIISVATFWLALVLSPLRAGEAKLDLLRGQAEHLEKEGNWEQACLAYADLFSKDRQYFESLRDRYQTCLRHIHQTRRHHDPTIRQQVLSKDTAVVLKAYGEVLAKLRANYFERDKVDLTRLFHHGLKELQMDLEDDFFLREYLPLVNRPAVQAFRNQLEGTWRHTDIKDLSAARDQALEVALAAQKAIGLKPVIVILELACGACNALDEHTLFLTPGLLRETYASLEGKQVGVGIELELTAKGRLLVISRVLKGSPAEMADLKPHDRVTHIDSKPVDDLSAEAAMDRLKGDAGTYVELEVLPAGQMLSRTLVLMRQVIFVPSIIGTGILEPGIGYFQLAGFQETTVQEMDDAINLLKMQGMKVLIMDLRGNPGGLFDVAIQVAQRFLSSGVIVTAQSQVPEFNKTYEANNSDALRVPLVVLIDSETASAAEMIAGAFKDNRRATLVGQTTYGKGSVQYVIDLTTVPGGIKITRAKFFSPSGHAYNKGGVVPHIIVARTSIMAFDEAQLQSALQTAQRLVMMEPMR
jgi:carboxyl-terminal processing protease